MHQTFPIANAAYEAVNELREREFPSLAKEGCREAAGWFDQEIHYLANTTPALRATPPELRRGISLVCQFIHTFYDRTSHSIQDFARSQTAPTKGENS